MAQFCTRAFRLTSRCLLIISPMQKLDSQYNFNFNGVTVRVIYTTKSLKIQSQSLLFYIDPLTPSYLSQGSSHPQDLGGGGDRLSIFP